MEYIMGKIFIWEDPFPSGFLCTEHYVSSAKAIKLYYKMAVHLATSS